MTIRTTALLLALAFIARTHAADVTIAPDRMLVINGQRTFIIGLYENPKDDTVLNDVAHAGFNLLRADDTAGRDRLQQHGLYAWSGTGDAIKAPDTAPASVNRLRKLVEAAKDHPALAVWEVPDEILWSTWLSVNNNFASATDKLQHLRADTANESDAIARGYALLKRLDPYHPVWMNHAAGNSIDLLASYARGTDIVACDLYPLMPYPTAPFDYSRGMLASIGLTTDRMQATAPGKPYWMVLQGMGWGDFENPVFTLQPRESQRPTLDESRFMAYDTIVHGARGVLYWGTYILPKDAQLWRDTLATARDLADHAPLLAAPDADLTPTIDTRYFGLLPWPATRGNIGVRALGKILPDKNGIPQTHWIIVNELPFPVGYTLNGLTPLEGQTYTPENATTPTTVQNNQLTGILPRYGIHIFHPS